MTLAERLEFLAESLSGSSRGAHLGCVALKAVMRNPHTESEPTRAEREAAYQLADELEDRLLELTQVVAQVEAAIGCAISDDVEAAGYQS